MSEIYLDCEYAKFDGELISMALVVDREQYLYLVRPESEIRELELGRDEKDGWLMDPWVAENVIPVIWSVPEDVRDNAVVVPLAEMGTHLSHFLYQRPEVPVVVCDWPEDFIHFNRMLLTGPGRAVYMNHQTNMVCLRHIDVFPTTLVDAVRHNAWWDAMALREFITK